MTTPTPDKLLTAAEVAERLGVSVASVYQLGYRGQLPAPVKLGRRVRWRESTIDQIVSGGQ